MKRETMNKLWIPTSLLAAAIVSTGCDVGDKTAEIPSVTNPRIEMPTTVADAGIAAQVDQTPEQQAMSIAQKRAFVTRADAFALLPIERMFDRQQSAARLVSEGGGFVNMFTTPEEAVVTVAVTEPLPNWRLSGVVIGDGVAALLDMGNTVVDIRPGQKVPDTEWVVVSIDPERAVLRRDNGKIPKYFVVPLSSANEANTPQGGGGNVDPNLSGAGGNGSGGKRLGGIGVGGGGAGD